MKCLFTLLLVVVFASCSQQVELRLPESGLEFELQQRNSFSIPCSEEVILTIGDITRGQVLAKVSWGEETLYSGSLRENEVVEFVFYEQKYSLRCIRLVNKLISGDYGLFLLKKGASKMDPLNEEEKKIEALIHEIRNSEIVFIRNGKEHSANEAADHLKMKWNRVRDEVNTYNLFVEKLASKSSFSGKEYQVRLKSGKTIPAKKWIKSLSF